MEKITILWADDEIDLLKPQILFLEEKGYKVVPVSNAQDAIDIVEKGDQIDVIFLDEHMPGITGLEALPRIKSHSPNIPVVLITRNEEENLMEDAIGKQISDYLIKPVKPNQLLLTLKKLIDTQRLVSEKTSSAYQQEFQKIFLSFQSQMDHREWYETYKKVIYWELELDRSRNKGMQDVLEMQKQEANVEFSKFIMKNYINWLKKGEGDDVPVLSHNLLKKKVFPRLSEDKPTFLIVIDNLRLDQWKMIQPFILQHYRQVEEDGYYSILPTATQYSRNAIFAGLAPAEIEKNYPQYWKNDEEEGGKNLHEHDLLKAHLKRAFKEDIKHDYVKITNFNDGKNLDENIFNYANNQLTVIVYNFIDMLSHARTEMEVLKELAYDEAAYRSLTVSWWEHSPLQNIIEKLASKNIQLIITTDHGTIRVKQPSKCIGDRNTTTNIRYKNGKNLNFIAKDVFEIPNPQDAFLPRPHVSSSYIFAKEDTFFVYPNNYNYYVNYFKNTFQHGGISLEEVIVPIATFTSK